MSKFKKGQKGKPSEDSRERFFQLCAEFARQFAPEIFRHRGAIERAIWLFTWSFAHSTKEIRTPGESWDVVLDGAPTPITKIARATGAGFQTTKKHIQALTNGGYWVTLQRGRAGIQIAVRRTKKFWRKPEENPLSEKTKRLVQDRLLKMCP